jgi:alcohol dehydrogenase class IV
VGAVFNTHHGTTNAAVMSACLAFNRPAIEDRIEQASAYLGIAGGFDGFAARVVELNEMFSIPKGLAAMGVDASRLDELTDMALQDPSVGGNPVEMTKENTRALFDAAM